MPFSDLGKPYPIIEVSFNNGSRKDFYRNNTGNILESGSWVAVEGAGGFDVGQISLVGELVKLQMKKYGVSESAEIKRVLRPAGDRDIELHQNAKRRERDTLIRSRAIAKELNLEMKIAEAEYQADGKKVSFFYTADSRVDFRELIKVYAAEFRAKVEMRQIGARQESGKVGGIGSCGRELCCSSWLSDFKTVNTTAARYQNLSINQTKLSGQCGRLKCCLNYELDTYMDALHSFPEGAEQIEMAAGRAYLQKKDIFRNLMWYSFGGSNKQYPLTIERVQEILALNAEGQKPEDMEAVEIQVRHKGSEKTVDMGFVNDVGQLTLSSLSKSAKKKQQAKQRQQQQPKQGGQQPRQTAQGPGKPQQQQKQGQGQKQAQPAKQQQGDNKLREQKPKGQEQQQPGNKQQQQQGKGQQKQGQQPQQQKQEGQPRPPREPRPPQADGTQAREQRPQQQKKRPNNNPPREKKDTGDTKPAE